MQATKEDLMRLEHLQSEMADAKAGGYLKEYMADEADYILHCLTLMTYAKGGSTHDQTRGIGTVPGTASGF